MAKLLFGLWFVLRFMIEFIATLVNTIELLFETEEVYTCTISKQHKKLDFFPIAVYCLILAFKKGSLQIIISYKICKIF